jgi:hypothetical protein
MRFKTTILFSGIELTVIMTQKIVAATPRLLLVLLFSGYLGQVQGAYYRCTDAAGGAVFQSSPCDPARDSIEDPPKSQFSLRIEGDAEFILKVNHCMALLAAEAPEADSFVRENIGVISQHDTSGMKAYENPPRFLFSDKSASDSVSWCASCIVHDAYHSYLYQMYKPDDGGHPTYDLWAGFAAERAANRYQLEVLQQIGAPPHEIKHMRDQDGTHADTNRDGVIDDQDQIDW